MGHSASNERIGTARRVIDELKSHPNYKQQIPLPNETKTGFILRSVAHLISPPQEPGESCSIECVDLASAVRIMEKELEDIWNNHTSI